MQESLYRNRILIFGGTGSLGKKLIERFKESNLVYVYSRDEAKHWTIRNEIAHQDKAKNVNFFVGDIRDPHRVKECINLCRPSVIIVAAALKQVDTCELSPYESVKTNLLGTQNVLDAVDGYTPDLDLKVLFVSTDKACSPVNVYGMCKSTSERLVTSKAAHSRPDVTYLATRYGNVLESRGSIIPLFKYQAENAEHLTVTDPEMTRFVMTLDDSVDLIVNTLLHGKSGETWIPVLPAMKIGDLAQIFAERHEKEIKIIGLRPGEKKHEDLVNESESVRTMKHETGHYVIGPAFNAGDSNKRFTYTSNDDVMTKKQLFEHLKKLGIIDRALEQFTGKNIEEIRK